MLHVENHGVRSWILDGKFGLEKESLRIFSPMAEITLMAGKWHFSMKMQYHWKNSRRHHTKAFI